MHPIRNFCVQRADRTRDYRFCHRDELSRLAVMGPTHTDALVAAQPYNDLADLMPRHVILVGRLDVQSSTGRRTWEIRC